MPQKRSTRQSIKQIYSGLAAFEAALRRGLDEDGWDWDWTTMGSLRIPDQRVQTRVVAKSAGIWAADALVEALARVEPEIETRLHCGNGDPLRPGETVLEWTGPARQVLALERPFLNLAAYVGGIATKTAALVAAAAEACPEQTPRITATRKTLPGYRDIAICGVLAGGGFSHRVSLAGGVLIKENHIAAAGGIARAIEGVRAVAPHGLIVEVEVRDLAELREALDAGAGGVLLDNFGPEQVSSALERIDEAPVRPVVEVSGGIDETNVADYAIPGVDVLSSGSLTHSVRAIDLSLLISASLS